MVPICTPVSMRIRVLMFNATFIYIFQLYRGGQFYWWRKPEYPEKTTDLSQVTDKTLSHNVLSSTPHHKWNLNISGDRH